MIIWINGAFGSGKTQTAYELNRRISDSYVYDPENAGFFIRKNLPEEALKDDFQNYTMWREFNYSMLKYINDKYSGTVIVPMTIVNPVFFSEIVGRLRNEDVVINHFALCASRDVILKRLRCRGEGRNSWAAQQIDRCVEGLSNEVFKQHIDTEKMSVENVAERIAALSNISLLPETGGRIRKKYERVKTQLKHIRFFG